MTSTDRLVEMAAEIDRLRAEIKRLQHALTQSVTRNCERIMEIERLKAEYAVAYGSFRAAVLDEPDEPATITHGHTPSAPPHDER